MILNIDNSMKHLGHSILHLVMMLLKTPMLSKNTWCEHYLEQINSSNMLRTERGHGADRHRELSSHEKKFDQVVMVQSSHTYRLLQKQSL